MQRPTVETISHDLVKQGINFIQDGKGRRSQEAIEGKWQQLQDRIGTNIKNLPKSYVEREKGAPCREVGYEYSFSGYIFSSMSI